MLIKYSDIKNSTLITIRKVVTFIILKQIFSTMFFFHHWIIKEIKKYIIIKYIFSIFTKRIQLNEYLQTFCIPPNIYLIKC